MEGGDISADVPVRMLMVWEGLVALPKRKKPWDLFVKRSTLYVPNDIVCRRVWDLNWRLGYRLNLVTFEGARMVDELEAWVERYDLPFSHCFAYDMPLHLQDELAFMPSVVRIFDPMEDRVLMWGRLGQFWPADRDVDPLLS